MNVVMFTNTYAPLVGGIERSVATLTEDLREGGHQTLVVTPQFEGAEESDDLVFRIPAIKNVQGTQFSLKLPIPSGLTDRLDHFAPSLVHAHQPFMLGDTALRKARTRGIPLVYTNHTLWERYADHFPLPPERAERLTHALPTEYANLCDLVIAPTASVKAILEGRGVTVPIEVVPTGIETALYQGGDRAAFRAAHGLPAEAFVAGHLGRLVQAKNLDFLARAVAKFLQQETDAWFLCAGDGESVEAMKSAFAEAGVAERTVFLGTLHGREVADAYAAMDVFAFTSLTDTQGLVLIEAMTGGTPIVALDAPGARDTIEDGVHGRLLSADAGEEDFATALAEVRRKGASFAEAAKKRAAEFDRKACSRRMLQVYENLLAGWKRAEEHQGLSLWELFEERLKAEFALLSEKASIAKAALFEPEQPAKEEEEKTPELAEPRRAGDALL